MYILSLQLGALAKLLKAIISFVMPVCVSDWLTDWLTDCLSVCESFGPTVHSKYLGYEEKDFHKICYWIIIICRENLRFIKIWQNELHLIWKPTYIYKIKLLIYS